MNFIWKTRKKKRWSICWSERIQQERDEATRMIVSFANIQSWHDCWIVFQHCHCVSFDVFVSNESDPRSVSSQESVDVIMFLQAEDQERTTCVPFDQLIEKISNWFRQQHACVQTSRREQKPSRLRTSRLIWTREFMRCLSTYPFLSPSFHSNIIRPMRDSII